MPHILVVTGSIRPNNVNQKVVPLVVAELEAQGADVTIADLGVLNLPFFDDPHPPTSPDFAPTHETVLTWTEQVKNADGVVFVAPEYNHTLSPIQINAVDWIGKEWADKPIGLIGYGWTSGGAQALDAAREALAVVLSARVAETQAALYFGKHLGPDGTVADEAVVSKEIQSVIQSVLALTSQAA
jgi:NAD(P)H-dependent FMN reductase